MAAPRQRLPAWYTRPSKVAWHGGAGGTPVFSRPSFRIKYQLITANATRKCPNALQSSMIHTAPYK
jgi:hypothetical protein